jgi:hypothetical protein
MLLSESLAIRELLRNATRDRGTRRSLSGSAFDTIVSAPQLAERGSCDAEVGGLQSNRC